MTPHESRTLAARLLCDGRTSVEVVAGLLVEREELQAKVAALNQGCVASAAPEAVTVGAFLWPRDWDSCPECRGSFSFSRPLPPALTCPWCGFRPEETP